MANLEESIRTLTPEQLHAFNDWLDERISQGWVWNWVGWSNVVLAISNFWTHWHLGHTIVWATSAIVFLRCLYELFINTPQRYVQRLKKS